MKAPSSIEYLIGQPMPGTKWVVRGKLGQGGMGIVLDVVKEQLIRGAMKVLLPPFAKQPEFAAKFFEEVKVTARLQHPNIVQVLDFDRLLDGTPFMVMERLRGRTLRAALRTDAPRSLTTALHALARDPHRRFERHEAMVPLSMLRDVRFERLPVYLASTRRWVTGAHGLQGLGIDVDGVVPAELPEPRVRDTFDTAENRFARAFVDHAIFIVDATLRAVRKRACEARVQDDARMMLAQLEAARRTAPLCDAGRLTQVPMGSTVLQRRRGYRDLLHHFVRMRDAVRGLPFSTEAFDALLEGRDVAHLYELWAFFRVVEALRAILGPPTSAEAPVRTELGVVVNRLEVCWGPDVRATYQEVFSQRKGTSYSLRYEPDVSLYAHGKLHLFDAKFRLERPGDGDEGSFRQADLDKMHAYRDAIRDARSAWVLYPGADAVFYDATGWNEAIGPSLAALRPASEGVGAIPLRPGDDRVSDLDRVLRGLLGASASERTGEALQQGAA
jgi:uncharacterized protein DUF2357/PD-(D/E)XK nuclease superfamily protein/protein kinase-like protein